MKPSRTSAIALLLPLVLVTATCAGRATEAPGPAASVPRADRDGPDRTLVVAVRGEPPSIASKPLASFSGLLDLPKDLFNAELDYRDEREAPHPYLAVALPELNTDTWKVFPDGRMETRYTLRANATWHDGQPLVADDFVFAHRVYATPELGQAATPPIGNIERVSAPDPRTIVITWNKLYADAAILGDGFPPLPSHLLAEAFRPPDFEAFAGLPFWSTEHVGLGAYRLARWEPGAFIEGQAFEGHVLGKPSIDRVKVLFIPDAQTALANVQSGEVHYVSDFVLTVPDGQLLEQQWAQDQGGTVLYTPVTLRYTSFQQRPDYVETPALLNVRVRMAIAYAVDAATAVNVFTNGKGVPTGTLTSPRVDYYPDIQRAIETRGYDPRRAQQLMEEAGYRKGSRGFFEGRDGQPLQLSVSSTSGVRNETVVASFVDNLRGAGFDASQTVVPIAQMRLPETSARVPGLQVRGGNNRYVNYTSGAIQSPENRWVGSNYGGWSDPDYDRAFESWLTTLARADRVRRVADMERIINEQVPIIPHFFDVQVDPHVAALEGPVARHTPDSGGPFLHVHNWRWRQ